MSESQPLRAAADAELERFVEAIRSSPEFQRFDEAREQLRADGEPLELVEQFERKQTEFQQNEFDQEILANLGIFKIEWQTTKQLPISRMPESN